MPWLSMEGPAVADEQFLESVETAPQVSGVTSSSSLQSIDS